MVNNRIRLAVGYGLLVALMIVMHPRLVGGQSSHVATVPLDRTRITQHVTIDIDNVPLVTALETIARQAGFVVVLNGATIPATTRVTLHARDMAVTEAFQRALRGTGLAASVHPRGDVIIVPDGGEAGNAGSIMGTVTDAKTKRPLRGAKVGLDGVDRVVETTDEGSYHLSNVPAGAHTLIVKLLGYSRHTDTVIVSEAQVTTRNVALESSAIPLDQVVVTGTVIPTALKAVPSAMTVITAKDIEQRGITKIDQLFHGDVPGLFAQSLGSVALLDEVTMFSRGATAFSTSSAGTSVTDGQFMFTNSIKTYVDGVELADSKYLSQIDPKSIERIEILTGPQASTIYGSNAINGVMQIFTKRGTSNTPQLTLNLLSGFVQNNFSSALTPQHDYSAQLSGLEGRLSYNAGGSWNYMGAWTPAKQSTRTGGFGGVRLELSTAAGRVTTDLTLRRTITQNLRRGQAQQGNASYQANGWYTNFGAPGLAQPTTSTLVGQTLGVTLSYAPTDWWSHELGVGDDASDTETRQTAKGYLSVRDTTVQLTQNHTDRRSLRYTTTARVPVASFVQATVTAGADAWQNLTSSMSVSPQTLTGTLTGTTTIARQPGHNTGGFLQTQLGIKDQFFFTYGLRAEWNPGYGTEAQPNYAPRYGIVYTQEVGSVTAKLRGSYGRSTRPPLPGLKVAQSSVDFFGSNWKFLSPFYAPYDAILANPELSPEHQQGGEGGLELYLGTRGSLVVTRYNQTVDGLIAQPNAVDSVRSLAINPDQFDNLGTDGYGYIYQAQYVNLGSIRNQGWELQGSVNTGPLTTRGTYSWTKSRTIGVNPKYRAQFANQPQYQPGATFKYLPEHTWALGVTYARARSTVELNVTGTGQVMNQTDNLYFQSLYAAIRLPQNRLKVSNTNSYISFNAAYALADLTASQRFSSRVEGVLQVQNLADRYINDYSAFFASLGRQSKAGLRIRL